MSANANLIDTILQSKGFALSFQQVMAGSVVCQATKGNAHFRVLARSVNDGLTELARLLGLNTAWVRV